MIYPHNVSKEKEKLSYLGAFFGMIFSVTLNCRDAKHHIAAVSVHHFYRIKITFLLFPPYLQLIAKTSVRYKGRWCDSKFQVI